MRKLILLAALGLMAGCGQTAGGPVTGSPTPADTVFAMRSAYDGAFLAPAANYNELPRCGAGQAPTLSAPCSRQSIVIALRKDDATAKAALDAAEDITRNHPTLDASAVIAAAQDAIDAATTVCKLWCAGTQE